MNDKVNNIRNKDNILKHNDIQKVGIVSTIGNILLLGIKICIAITSKSQGLIADTINSASDILTSVLTIIGNKLSNKPKDKEHPYGHGKIEYIVSLIISIIMASLAFTIFKDSILAIIDKKIINFSKSLIAVCIVTMLIKILLYVYCKLKYKSCKNLLIKSEYLDHRNDIFLSLSVIIGIITNYYGIYFVDGAVGIIISVWICISAIKLFESSCEVLIDTGITDEEKEKMTQKILQLRTCSVDSITSVSSGANNIIMIEIGVNEELKLKEAHDIADKVKETLINSGNIEEVIVHVNPKKIVQSLAEVKNKK